MHFGKMALTLDVLFKLKEYNSKIREHISYLYDNEKRKLMLLWFDS